MRSSFLPKPSEVVKPAVPASRSRRPIGATAVTTAPPAGVQYASAAVRSPPRISSMSSGHATMSRSLSWRRRRATFSAAELPRHAFEVLHEVVQRAFALVRIAAQDRGRVDGRGDAIGQRRVDELAALAADAKLAAQQCLGGRRSEADEHLWPHGRELPLEPWPTRLDLFDVGLLVDAPLAARSPLEVL